jgi:hypothetical protein
MKNSLAFSVLISLLCMPFPVRSQDVAGRDLDTDFGHSTLTWGFPYGAPETETTHFDIQSVLRSTPKPHFRFNELLALEFDFDGLPGFSDHSGSLDTDSPTLPPFTSENEDILTNMVVSRFSPYVGSRIFRPYASLGFGIMHVHENPVSDLETDTCAMIGLGARLFVTEKISLGIEGDHVWGFDLLHDVEYSNIGLGVAYHF